MERLSRLAQTLIPSEIIKLGNEISERVRAGATIYNFTIGDFDSNIFPIPAALEEAIVQAYREGRTNYPPANGIAELREAVAAFIHRRQGLDYPASSFLISGGGRPLIYAAYRTLCDPGDRILYPVPSWNNNHYTHFVVGEHVCIQTGPDSAFLPTAEQLIPHLPGARLLALCSPLNPTGTVFTREQLSTLCEAVLAENRRRGPNEKPLYILYDQIYWTLTYGDAVHNDPVSLFPELRDYTVYIDGISKAFCATGVRVGWAFGPADIIDRMKGILSHVGAWSPMAEQVGTARFLNRPEDVDQHLLQVRNALHTRLEALYRGICTLQAEGYPVEAIEPRGAMYLTLRFGLKGYRADGGEEIQSTEAISAFLLQEARLAIVPFAAFGADRESEWYRLSVGTCHLEDIPAMLQALRDALDRLVKAN